MRLFDTKEKVQRKSNHQTPEFHKIHLRIEVSLKFSEFF